MKKGKRFIENENLIIYVGTAIFFILAISVGIVMYMTTKTNSKTQNNEQQISQENQSESEIAENVSSNMGKTVEEQQKSEETPKTENTALSALSRHIFFSVCTIAASRTPITNDIRSTKSRLR